MNTKIRLPYFHHVYGGHISKLLKA